MSAHRQHAFDVAPPTRPEPPPGRWVREDGGRGANVKALLFILAAVAVGFLITLPLTLGVPTATTTPIATPRIETRTLPALDELQSQQVIARLRDWRAGYEAAVENGCKLQPLLFPPLGSRP